MKAKKVVPVDSNLELIEAAKFVDLVKVLSISLDGRYHLASNFNKLRLNIDKISQSWLSLTHLSIDVGTYPFSEYTTRSNVLQFPDSLRVFMKHLKTIAPNLNSFEIKGNMQCKPLMDIYSGNIEEVLHQDSYELVPQLSVHTKGSINDLTYLNMMLGPNADCQLVLFAANTLKYLELHNIHGCLQFGLNGLHHNSNVIEFPQLDTLVMSYKNGVSNEEIKTELHFPNLKTFKLKATHSDMTLAKLPKEIDRVKVCGTLQAFEVLRDVEKIQHLEADLKNIDDGTAGIVLPIRNLFDQNRVGKSGKLKLASDMTLLPQDLRLLKITHLNYKASIEQDMVLEFIKRLDMLIEVEFDNVLDDFIDVDYDSAETISTSLKSLVLQYNSRYGCNYVEPHLVNYLLLYLPSLQKLTATDIKDDLVKLHILQYKVRFPHLDDVDLCLASYDC
ncbi:hypothetical protein H4R22_000031 [Coemansia sp. RSA 1290]|nr:hypothetical protein H4R22_000031 [Coemansia sp. RSA 1290]